MAEFPSIFAPAPPPLDPRLLAPRGVIAPPGQPPAAFTIPGIAPRGVPDALVPKMPGPVIAPPSAPNATPSAIAAPTAAPRTSVGPIMPRGVLTPPDAMEKGPKLADILKPRRIEIGAAPEAEPPSGQAAVDQAKAAESAIQAPEYHGKLGVLEKIADAASRLLAPGIERRLGIGTIGYEDRLANAQAQTDRAEKELAEGATNEKAQADARLANAEAAKDAEPPQPPGWEALPYGATVEFNRATGETRDVPGAQGKTPQVQFFEMPDHSIRAFPKEPGVVIPQGATPLSTGNKTPEQQAFESLVSGGTDPVKAYQQLTAKNANGSYISPYARVRLATDLLNYAVNVDPRYMETAQSALGDALKSLSLGGAPVLGVSPDQPQDEAGNPLGLRQPGAPTTTTRNRGQQAADVMPNFDQAAQLIVQLGPEIGPLQGRWNEFLTGKIGSDNPEFAKLRTNLDLLNGAYTRFHLNTEMGYKTFSDLLNAAQSPGNLLATLGVMRSLAERYAASGAGRPTQNGAADSQSRSFHFGEPSGEWTPPPGAPSADREPDGAQLTDQSGKVVAVAHGGKWTKPNA